MAHSERGTYRGYVCATDRKTGARDMSQCVATVVEAYQEREHERPAVLVMHPEDVPATMPLEANGLRVVQATYVPRGYVYAGAVELVAASE